MKESALSVFFLQSVQSYTWFSVSPTLEFYTMCNLTRIQPSYHNFHTIHDLGSRMVVCAVLSRGNFCANLRTFKCKISNPRIAVV